MARLTRLLFLANSLLSLKSIRIQSGPSLYPSSLALLVSFFCTISGGPVLVSNAAGQELTLQMLRDAPELTPEAFMAFFRDFSFKLGDEVQDPAVFLASRTGDCDDFASLAASVFRERNMTTELIAVYMNDQTHVVCHLREAGIFLDFNQRASEAPLQRTDGLLEDIAEQVSAYFRLAWHFAADISAGPRNYGRVAFH